MKASVRGPIWTGPASTEITSLPLDFEHLQGVIATSGHGIEQRTSVVLDSALDQHLVRQSEAEEMNAPSFADALIVQALGGGSSGVQGSITSGTGKIVVCDGETVGRKKGTRPPTGRPGLPQQTDSHSDRSEAVWQVGHDCGVSDYAQPVAPAQFGQSVECNGAASPTASASSRVCSPTCPRDIPDGGRINTISDGISPFRHLLRHFRQLNNGNSQAVRSGNDNTLAPRCACSRKSAQACIIFVRAFK